MAGTGDSTGRTPFGRLQTARRSVVRHAALAHKVGFQAHEESLTELVLTRADPYVKVRKFNQREEARTGADWIWLFEGDPEWFALLVQAKRNKPKRSAKRGSASYDFGYTSGKATRSQVSLLLNCADRLQVPAIYALYNYPGVRAQGTPLCRQEARESLDTRLGVATLPALIARDSLSTGLESVPSWSLPLECLACPSLRPTLAPTVRSAIANDEVTDFLDGHGGDLAHNAARALLAQLAWWRRLGQLRAAGPQPTTAVEHPGFGKQRFARIDLDVAHDGESYLDHVLRGLTIGPPSWWELADGGAPDGELADLLPGIEGVALFSGRARSGR